MSIGGVVAEPAGPERLPGPTSRSTVEGHLAANEETLFYDLLTVLHRWVLTARVAIWTCAECCLLSHRLFSLCHTAYLFRSVTSEPAYRLMVHTDPPPLSHSSPIVHRRQRSLTRQLGPVHRLGAPRYRRHELINRVGYQILLPTNEPGAEQ
jgi:hypothetical protein